MVEFGHPKVDMESRYLIMQLCMILIIRNHYFMKNIQEVWNDISQLQFMLMKASGYVIRRSDSSGQDISAVRTYNI